MLPHMCVTVQTCTCPQKQPLDYSHLPFRGRDGERERGRDGRSLRKYIRATVLLLAGALKESGRRRGEKMVKWLLGNHPFQMERDLSTMECVHHGSTG